MSQDYFCTLSPVSDTRNHGKMLMRLVISSTDILANKTNSWMERIVWDRQNAFLSGVEIIFIILLGASFSHQC